MLKGFIFYILATLRYLLIETCKVYVVVLFYFSYACVVVCQVSRQEFELQYLKNLVVKQQPTLHKVLGGGIYTYIADNFMLPTNLVFLSPF